MYTLDSMYAITANESFWNFWDEREMNTHCCQWKKQLGLISYPLCWQSLIRACSDMMMEGTTIGFSLGFSSRKGEALLPFIEYSSVHNVYIFQLRGIQGKKIRACQAGPSSMNQTTTIALMPIEARKGTSPLPVQKIAASQGYAILYYIVWVFQERYREFRCTR